jgi:hypothetical protein
LKLIVTRFTYDDARLYSVELCGGNRPGMSADELKCWLLDLGLGDSTIAVVLDISPGESITVDVPESHGRHRQAS